MNKKKVWLDTHSVLRTKTMHESISFDRHSKIVKRRIYDWPQEKQKNLSIQEFDDLDQFLSSLLLVLIKSHFPTPPGESDDIRIVNGNHTVRLGRKSNTEGEFYELNEDEYSALFKILKKSCPL